MMKALSELKIIIADDHALLLNGLKSQLTLAGLQVIGEANDGAKALQLIVDNSPDIAVLDIEMPYLSGFSIVDQCKEKGLNTKFIILSLHKEPEFVAQAKQIGISGYVLKEDATSEILTCIEAISKGEMYFSKALSEGKLSEGGQHEHLNALTPSEKKILKLIAQRNNTQEIAERLFISERTVEKHRSNVVAKLKLSGQSNSLTHWAIENRAIINAL